MCKKKSVFREKKCDFCHFLAKMAKSEKTFCKKIPEILNFSHFCHGVVVIKYTFFAVFLWWD
jgi:hypothetical protein